MPTYEYQCGLCGHRFEQLQSISDEPLTQCPRSDCQGTVSRLISSGAGFLFKGSGFYITDYRSSSYKKAAESESSSKAPSSSSASAAPSTGAATGSKPADSKPGGTAKKES